MMGLVKRLLRHSGMRYLVVGGASFALNVLILNILEELLGWDYAIAAPAAFLLTFAVPFTLQRAFTFRSEAEVNGAVARYLVLAGFNALAQWPLHALGSQFGLGTASRQFVATGIITVWNYFIYRHWVYVDRTHPLPADEETVAWHERARRHVRTVVNIGPVRPVADMAAAEPSAPKKGDA